MPAAVRATNGCRAYAPDMPARSTPVDVLLQAMENGTLVPERYSRMSLFDRCEPALRAAALAAFAIVSGMLLGGAAEQPQHYRFA